MEKCYLRSFFCLNWLQLLRILLHFPESTSRFDDNIEMKIETITICFIVEDSKSQKMLVSPNLSLVFVPFQEDQDSEVV